MDKTKQQIKIAEACGWTNITGSGKAPNDKQFILKDGEIWTSLSSPIPDYLNDLNAMHEGEESLTRDQYFRYYHNLLAVIENGCLFAIRATAERRAEAFLRTLGLWEESK